MRTATEWKGNPTGRWRSFTYEELMQRDEVSLDIFWLATKASKTPPTSRNPGEIAEEIIEDLKAAFEQLEAIQADFSAEPV